MTFPIFRNHTSSRAGDHTPSSILLHRQFVRQISRIAVLIAVLASDSMLSAPANAQSVDPCVPSHGRLLLQVLDFETPFNMGASGGWYGGPGNTVSPPAVTARNGKRIVRIVRTTNSPGKLSLISNCVHLDFVGKSITLRARLRTRGVSGFAALWMRENGERKNMALANMRKKNLHGTHGWKQYSITLPIKARADQLLFGALLSGTGTAWVSNLKLQADGKPLSQAPLRKTVNDTDRQFDKGSGISIAHLGKTQIANLVTLGKVWGFLKYYDPMVTAGHKQWDYALFREMPTILAAQDRPTANAELARWVAKLGPIKPCNPCVHLDDKGLQLHPDLAWIRSSQRLGSKLSGELQRIYANRVSGSQFYVEKTTYGSMQFTHERTYKNLKLPDSGFQLLALYRFWNIIEYWYPYRNVVGEDWDGMLARFIPRFAAAQTHRSYVLQVMALMASIHDSHANLWSSLSKRPPVGRCYVPVRLYSVENQPVVTGFVGPGTAKSSKLKPGDVITSVDDRPVYKLEKQWAPYYGASNTAALQRQLVDFLTRGNCGPVALGIWRDDHLMHVVAQRMHLKRKTWSAERPDPVSVLTGPAFQLLTPQVAYLNLSKAKRNKISDYINQAKGAKGLIIDDRREPSNGAYPLNKHLVNKVTPITRTTNADLNTPGTFHWGGMDKITPAKPHYRGKVVILVDSHTQSYGEYTAMALRAAPHAIVVGSTTAGADGVMSKVTFPGGLWGYISGYGVFYPDKQPTQRIGIIPDVVVRPTIEGIRAGRDQVLEAAIRQIVGPKVPLARIEAMYQGRQDKQAGH